MGCTETRTPTSSPHTFFARLNTMDEAAVIRTAMHLHIRKTEQKRPKQKITLNKNMVL